MTELKPTNVIMVTKMQRHSQLVDSSSENTDQVNTQNNVVREALIEKHLGRWIEGLDDTFLASFDNPISALACAKEFQASITSEEFDLLSINIIEEKPSPANGIPTGTSNEDFDLGSFSAGIFISNEILERISYQELFDLDIIPQKTAISKPREGKSSELSMDEVLLEKLEQCINDNLKNEQFSVEDLADNMALSRSHLHRKLQKLTGQSISQFIRSIRLDNAMAHLENEVATVSEIAYRVGFGSPTYFIKCFTEQYGFSPGEVKKKKDANINSSALTELIIQKSDDGQIGGSQSTEVKPKPSVIETLQFSSSDLLVREIFEEMAIHKESLKKFLLVDEDEGDEVDVRLLAYQMIKNYPWPIGVELRRLFSASLRQAGPARLRQIDKIIERTVRFLNYILISDLTENLYNRKISIDDKVRDELLSSLSSLQISHQISIIKLIIDVFKKSKRSSFIQEFAQSIDQSFFRELDEWADFIANKNSNGLPDTKIAEACENFEQMLILILKKSAFLVKYKLVNIGTIKVLKQKHKPADFQHHIEVLNSSDSMFRTVEENLADFADSNSVLLMKSIKDPKNFLNLSPLLVDTHGVSIDTTRRDGLKKDIYMFRGESEKDNFYKGCETNDKLKLASIPGLEYIAQEINELKTTIRND